jgi:hypothetical protein
MEKDPRELLGLINLDYWSNVLDWSLDYFRPSNRQKLIRQGFDGLRVRFCFEI